jgi:uncharacterized protein YcbK (DUF882 family)
MHAILYNVIDGALLSIMVITNPHSAFTRRTFLKIGSALLVASANRSWAIPATRSLSFTHTHTSETLNITYWRDGAYDHVGLSAVNHYLRDFRTGDVHAIAPGLLDYLHTVQCKLGCDAPFAVISGFRSWATNELLYRTTSGVAPHSLHLEGRAIDIRIPGVKTRHLREAAAGLQLGGVGYYPASDFVHLDTGRFRQW